MLLYTASIASSAEEIKPPAYPNAPLLSCGLKPKDGKLVTDEGVIDLKWVLRGAKTYELVAASPDDPEHYQNRYHGTDRSSVLTGMRDGMYRFKVRGINADGTPGEWSEPLQVEVAYMPASNVRLLLILGGLVVLMTVGAILHGYLTHRGKEAAV